MTTLNGSNLPLLKALASPFVSLHHALTVCEDRWTWTTTNGDFYEDVVLLDINGDTVTIQHKYGVDTLARIDLDHETEQYLIDNPDAGDSYAAGRFAPAVAEHFRHAA